MFIELAYKIDLFTEVMEARIGMEHSSVVLKVTGCS